MPHLQWLNSLSVCARYSSYDRRLKIPLCVHIAFYERNFQGLNRGFSKFCQTIRLILNKYSILSATFELKTCLENLFVLRKANIKRNKEQIEKESYIRYEDTEEVFLYFPELKKFTSQKSDHFFIDT